MSSPEELNERFALPDALFFTAGPGELTLAEINNSYASATVALQGGHVMTYQPHGHPPVLWLSRYSHYQAGKSIRGGIPVCWPWFGAHPTEAGKPAHGFVRTCPWAVTGTQQVEGETQIRLEISDDEASRALWPYPFRLQLAVTIGPELKVTLLAHNPGPEPFSCSGALHSYFSVSDAAGITIHGLDGRRYLDKVEAFALKEQSGPVTITAETDRIYLETPATCLLEDPGWQRRISIAKNGSQTTVVWNPWAEKARAMADFGEEEYRGMVCIETANAAGDVIHLAPGQAHQLEAVISSELNSQ